MTGGACALVHRPDRSHRVLADARATGAASGRRSCRARRARRDGDRVARRRSARGIAPPPSCEEKPGVTFFTSPAVLVAGRPMRVLAVSDKPLVGELRVAPSAAKLPGRYVGDVRRAARRRPSLFVGRRDRCTHRRLAKRNVRPEGLRQSLRRGPPRQLEGRHRRSALRSPRRRRTASGRSAAHGRGRSRSVFRMDRDAVRRARWRAAELAGAPRGAPRPEAQRPLRSSRQRRGQRQDARRSSVPIARTCPTSCARTSRGSCGCRSVSPSAIAAAVARRPRARASSRTKIPTSAPRRRRRTARSRRSARFSAGRSPTRRTPVRRARRSRTRSPTTTR